MVNQEVINKIATYKNIVSEYFMVEKMYLFGSYAKGEQTESSDIDVAIVLKKMEGDYFANIPIFWRLRRSIDDRIEPVVFEKGKDDSGFLTEIMNSGIEI